jgi:AcrR family transcriptional regulator
MPATHRRARAKQATRRRILDAARALLLAEGVAGFSMRKLAARIGYSATAIYFHFPDKDALLTELVDSEFIRFRQSFERFRRVADPLERLRRMGRAYVEFALRYPDHYRFMFMHSALRNLPRNTARRGNPAEDCYAFFRGVVAEGIACRSFRPELADPDQLAQVIWYAVHGLAALQIARGEDPWVDWRPVGPTARLLVDAILRGVARQVPPAAPASRRGRARK